MPPHGTPASEPIGEGQQVSIATVDCWNRHFALSAAAPNYVYYTTQCDEGKPVRMVRWRKDQLSRTTSALQELTGPDGVARYGDQVFGYVAVDSSFVYWSHAFAIQRLDLDFKAGAEPEELVSIPLIGIYNFVVEDRLYVRTRSDVRAYDKAGGGLAMLATHPASEADPTGLIRLPLAVSGDDVYFSKVSPPTLHRVAKGGGAVTEIATATSEPVAIRVDDTHVYWATRKGEVWRVRR